MRIALMTNNYKPFVGGVPISVERLAKSLKQLGHEVTVFAPTYAEQVEEEDVFRYASCMERFIGGVILPNPFDRRIEREFRKNQYDIIHVHHPMLIGRTAVYLSKKYHIPLTFTYHTRYEQYLSYVGVIRSLEKGASRENGIFCEEQRFLLHMIQDKIVPAYLHTFLKHCNFIFAPTKGMQDYLQTVCKVPCENTDILPTGIEEHHYKVMEEKMAALRRQYGAEKLPLFLSVSRMSHEKNVSFLLESIRRIKELYRKPFRVLMVGDGPNREDYEKKCRELQIEEEVVFTGTVPNTEIAPYFAAADAFLFASKTETQGIVIMEALAGGTPVYALDATGVSDIVVNGKNGYLSEENIDVYVGKILDFLNGETDRRRLSECAYETALEYREEAVAGKAIRLYNSVIAAYESESKQQVKVRWHGLKILTAK